LFLVLVAGLAATTSQWLRAERTAAREAAIAAREAAARSEIEMLTQQLLALAQRLEKLEDSQPRAALPALPRGTPAGLERRAPPRPSDLQQKKASELTELRAQAKPTLRRLQQLSPTLAQRYQETFPELVGD